MTKASKELHTRTLSAVALGGAVLFITWWNAVSFHALVLLGAFLMLKEWFRLAKGQNAFVFILGVLYIGAGCISLAAIRQIYGWEMTYFLFALVWIGDIAAYFVGKKFGKHKIAPRISPGKSWQGLAGSIISTAAFSGWILAIESHYETLHTALGIGAAFAVLGLLGDLLESYMKRKAGVKDSGTLIPGHGGLLDRVDALLPCAVLGVFLLLW